MARRKEICGLLKASDKKLKSKILRIKKGAMSCPFLFIHKIK
jgi:hypothetical protein